MSGCNSRQPHQFPLCKPRTSLCSRVPKTQLAWGSTRAACQFPFRGRGRQAMHLPCKQADAGALPADSTNLPLQECSGSFSLSGIKVQSTQMEEDVRLETLFVPIAKGLFYQTLDFIV